MSKLPNMRTIEPCIICGTREYVHEYMVDEHRSYMQCEKCRVSTECGNNAFETMKLWNDMMENIPFLIEI